MDNDSGTYMRNTFIRNIYIYIYVCVCSFVNYTRSNQYMVGPRPNVQPLMDSHHILEAA